MREKYVIIGLGKKLSKSADVSILNYTSPAPWNIVAEERERKRGESDERNYELLSAAVH